VCPLPQAYIETNAPPSNEMGLHTTGATTRINFDRDNIAPVAEPPV